MAIDHWVDTTFFIIHWGGTATDTQFVSCTPVLAGLAVDDVAQAEGSGGGTTPFVFTVSRSHNADAVSVTAATMDGSAEAGTDYTSVPPVVLDFAAGGGLSQTVTVDVAADDAVELDENFTLELSNAVNASIADGTGDGTIQNDDAPAELTIDDVPQTEGSGGGTTIQAFTVIRSHNLETVSVQAQSVDGTATAGSDYTGVGPTTLNFPAGGVFGQEVAISVAADDLVELDEGYTVELSGAVNATILDGIGDGTIVNDDAATISIDSASQPEGSGGGTVPFVFTVTLDAAVDTGVAVDFDSADGTAEDESGDGDYAAALGTVQFAAGAGGSASVTIDVAADDRPERDEDFFVDLSNMAADGRDVTLAVDRGTATLDDDDDACPGSTVYRQPWDSPPDLRGHLATSGPDATFENVVDGGGATVPLPPGQVSGLRAWGIGRDGGLPCPLDPAVPFDLIFAADAAGAPGAVLAQRAAVTPAITPVAPDVFQIDLFFAPFDAGRSELAFDPAGGERGLRLRMARRTPGRHLRRPRLHPTRTGTRRRLLLPRRSPDLRRRIRVRRHLGLVGHRAVGAPGSIAPPRCSESNREAGSGRTLATRLDRGRERDDGGADGIRTRDLRRDRPAF